MSDLQASIFTIYVDVHVLRERETGIYRFNRNRTYSYAGWQDRRDGCISWNYSSGKRLGEQQDSTERCSDNEVRVSNGLLQMGISARKKRISMGYGNV